MLTVKGKSSMQEGTFFSQAAALVEDLGLNIELGGPGVGLVSCPCRADFFFADTGIEVTFCHRHPNRRYIDMLQWTLSGRSVDATVDAQWTLQWTLQKCAF